MRKAFPEGIFWLTVGQEPNLLGLQGQLVSQLTGAQPPAFVTVQQGKDVVREALAGRRALVVLDDVWTIEDADAFWVDAPPPQQVRIGPVKPLPGSLFVAKDRFGVLNQFGRDFRATHRQEKKGFLVTHAGVACQGRGRRARLPYVNDALEQKQPLPPLAHLLFQRPEREASGACRRPFLFL